ncbi:MAG: ribonuclease P protein component [Gammaproteobacteria bacterium]|nr:ribonuclease P protein component [Gammaproteobacteria bacterium]
MAPSGLPPAARLLNAAEFQAVFANTRIKVSDRFFLMLVLVNNLQLLQPGSRLGLVIGKKNIAHAVQRNRIRRLIRASFRCSRDGLIPEQLDILVLVRKGADKLTNHEIHSRLNSLWGAVKRKHKSTASVPDHSGQ